MLQLVLVIQLANLKHPTEKGTNFFFVLIYVKYRTVYNTDNYFNITDENSKQENEVNKEDDPIKKYKMLLEDIEKKDEKKKNKDMEMEITWGLGIKDKAEELVKKKMTAGKPGNDISVGDGTDHIIIKK